MAPKEFKPTVTVKRESAASAPKNQISHRAGFMGSSVVQGFGPRELATEIKKLRLKDSELDARIDESVHISEHKALKERVDNLESGQKHMLLNKLEGRRA